MLQRVVFTSLISLSAAFAQTFDVASVKPAAPMTGNFIRMGANGGPGSRDPGQETFTNMSLSDLIQSAYDVKSYQVSGPGWLESTRFDVEAKVPTGATKAQARVMLQNLLADRFKLVVHHSTKEASIYALVVAKNGPKLKESAEEAKSEDDGGQPPSANVAPPPPVRGKDGFPQLPPGAGRHGMMMMMAPGGRMRMVANGTKIAGFIDGLSMQLDRPVIDMTGLTGTYDITLDFAPDPSIMREKMAAIGVGPPPGPPPDAGGGADGPADAGPAASIFTALPDQLGLKLEARKGPLDLVVVDSVAKTPGAN